MTIIGPSVSNFNPQSNFISYTDHSGVEVSSDRARFLRPVTHDNMQHISPGARIRFRTNSKIVNIRLGFNGLATTTYGDLFSILINGIETTYTTSGYPSNFNKILSFPTADFRNIELIFPFGGALDFLGVSIDDAASFNSCLPRPITKCIFLGDSITQGALGTKTTANYPFLIGLSNRFQSINVGLSGARLIHFQNLGWASSLNPDLIAILLGYNDFADQLSESLFRSRYETMIMSALNSTSAEIKVITPIWTNVSRSVPISTYRNWISSVITGINSPRISILNGDNLITNSTSHVPDGVHPNDLGFFQLAQNLRSFIQV